MFIIFLNVCYFSVDVEIKTFSFVFTNVFIVIYVEDALESCLIF